MDELTDFSSPFTLYVYAAFFILLLRMILVWPPLRNLFTKVSEEQGLLRAIFKLQKEANLKGIWGLVSLEIVSATAPAGLAIGLRLFVPLGDRQPVWTDATTIGFILVMAAIFAWQITDVLKVRDFLNKLDRRMNVLYKPGVKATIRTRSGLVWLATMKEPEFALFVRRNKEEKEPLFLRNEEGRIRVNIDEAKAKAKNFVRNTQAATYNSIQNSKRVAKKTGTKLRERMDKKMQGKINQVYNEYNPMKAFYNNLGMAIIPLLYIFLIMYR